MRNTEQFEEKKRKEADRKDRARRAADDEGDMDYVARPKWHYINDQSSVFDTKDETSINTMPSIFDRTAIFRTKQPTDESS